MAHIKTNYLKLWKPQDLSIDKISSQKMFVDNINALELFAQSILQNVHQSVQSLDELRAIDTSDRTIFKTGMLIMLNGYGIYSFNRDSTANESHAVVVPTAGGGRWIATNGYLEDKFAGINSRLENVERIPVHMPQYEFQDDVKYSMNNYELGSLLLLYKSSGNNGEFNIELPNVSYKDIGKRVIIHAVDCSCMITPYQGVIIYNQHNITIGAGDTVTMILATYTGSNAEWLAIQ